jgi:acetyl esterase/lipase
MREGGLPPPAHESPLPPKRSSADGARLLLGVPYAAISGIRPLELDLYLPPSGDVAPVVVFLHGGGWRLGSRHSTGPAFAGSTAFERVAGAGIAVASVDYRLSGEATWPAQLYDTKAAVRWLRARADELGIDPERIAAWGESAGGQLAALLGLTGDRPELEGGIGITGPSSRVSAVAAWYAPSDLSAVAGDLGADPMDPQTREAQLLGAPVPTAVDAAAQASPVTFMTSSAPPFLLMHGRVDRLIPCVQTERLSQGLRSAGADVEVHFYDQADHMWRGTPDVAEDALDRTIDFLRRHLLS